MKKIDDIIKQIESKRFAIKLGINSTYGINPNPISIQRLFSERDELTKELKSLQIIKDRKEKLDKIRQRNEESMEM